MDEYQFINLEAMKVLSVKQANCADAWQEMINFIIKKNIVH